MPRANRMLRILSLFDLTRPVLTPELLMAELGVSRASVYRDLGQLTQAGLIERVAERGYALGSTIVELDRQIRLGDPLLNAADSLLKKLADDSGGIVLLCRVHGSKVMCIHQVRGRNATLPVSYERGRAMPLYRGATSKIILANLPSSALKTLWTREKNALVKAGWPTTLTAFVEALAALRAQHYCISQGEVDPDALGMAVALHDGGKLLGSLSVVLPATGTSALAHRNVLAHLQSTARRIEARLEDERMKARSDTRARNSKPGNTAGSKVASKTSAKKKTPKAGKA
jgi:DNA-binding IclR family transcriptional regulator